MHTYNIQEMLTFIQDTKCPDPIFFLFLSRIGLPLVKTSIRKGNKQKSDFGSTYISFSNICKCEFLSLYSCVCVCLCECIRSSITFKNEYKNSKRNEKFLQTHSHNPLT